MAALSEDLEKIRRHFRKETGKIDNWMRHRCIDEFPENALRNEEDEKAWDEPLLVRDLPNLLKRMILIHR